MDKVTGQLKAHLQQMGAMDLAGIEPPVSHFKTPFRFNSADKNSIAIDFHPDKTVEVLVGLSDPHFSPVSLIYNDQGKIEAVKLPNSGRSGAVTYHPDPGIIGTVLKFGHSAPADGLRGAAVAALARAAGVCNMQGNYNWGTGLISEAAAVDTGNLSTAHMAIAAIQQKWQAHCRPAMPAAPKPAAKAFRP